MLACQRHLFDLPAAIAYLNTAYMSPQLSSVTEVGAKALERKGRPWEIGVDDFFEPVLRLRSLFNELIEGADVRRVAVIPSASYGLATVARNLQLGPGEEVVMVEEQFPSNVLTWQRGVRESGARLVTVAAPPPGPDRSRIWNARLLDAIGPRTRLVALGHVHWADGTLFDLEAVREKTRKFGAWLVIDGTQSVGALPFSVQKIQPDALVCAGYKWMLGPYSLGLAYYGPALDEGIPIEENWYNRLGSNNFGGLVKYQEAYEPLAQRYAVGESSNFALVPMLTRALEQLLEWEVSKVAAYSRSISREFIERMGELGLWLSETPERTHHLLGLILPEGIDLDRLRAALAREQVFVSIRGNAVRISVHVFNRPEELSRLGDLLEKYTRRVSPH